MKRIQLAAFVLTCASAVACQAAPIVFPTVCSAFDRQGDEATATFFPGKADIRVSPAGGNEPIVFSTSSRKDADGVFRCNIFFDQGSHYVALAMGSSGLTRGPLEIFVGELTTRTSIGNFRVNPGATLGESLQLVGFVRDSTSLAVLGSNAPSTRSFSVTLFSVTGEQETSTVARILPENTGSVGNISWVDAAHNRIWVNSNKFHCPLRSVPLVAGQEEEVDVDLPEAEPACDATIAVAYPDEDTIIAASTRGDTDQVTEIDLLKHEVKQVDLVCPKGRYTSVEGGSLTPDGKFFAVSRQILSLSFFGDTRVHGAEIDVMQLSPLKLVGKFHLEPTADSQSISISDRSGALTMLSFDFKSRAWKSQLLKVQ